MIIIPHLLEFDAFRFQTMREVERVLKPEGLLIVLNFNPWSLWIRYQYLWDKKMADSWGGHFISRSRILDWLKLLNFEVTVSSEFNLDTVKSTHGKFITRGHLAHLDRLCGQGYQTPLQPDPVNAGIRAKFPFGFDQPA